MNLQSFLTPATLVAFVLGVASSGHGDLLTVEFEGTINGTTAIVNAGDTFAGSFTLETTAPTTPFPPAFDFQSGPIRPDTFPGTGWSVIVNSSAVAPFAISGNAASVSSILLGNDIVAGVQTIDRYTVDLRSTDPLPGGSSLNIFQMVLQDNRPVGAPDMLAGNTLADIPDLSKANFVGSASTSGRFFTLNPNLQTPIVITKFEEATVASAAPVPEPSSIAIWTLIGLVGAGVHRRRKRQVA